MRTFAEILAIAALRKGGEDQVLAAVPAPRTADELAALPDHRWLAAMAGGIFATGLSTAVVKAKWAGIEKAFGGFDVGRVSMMDDDRFDALLADPQVIRSGAKIAAIRENAVFIRAEGGGFGRRVGDWPASDFAGLVQWLVREGSRLGGSTGTYVLRHMGRDGWILSRDVVTRLVAEGVVSGPPGSARALAAVQAAFDRWQGESGHNLTTISRVLAQSIGPDGGIWVMPGFVTTPQGRRLAHHLTPGAGPGVVFLGGFRSDMGGTKALWLEDWCRTRGRAFLRFDYSGHGASAGAFEDGCIGDWAADAMAVLGLTEGPQVLVGSSMGGWIALLLARAHPDRVAGLVGVAAAPDFMEDLVWANATAEERAELMTFGRIEMPSTSAETPDIITRRMIEDGRDQSVLKHPLALPMPARFLHGTADTDAPFSLGLRLLDHAAGPDIRLTLVKGADHRFSTPACLALVGQAVDAVLQGGGHA